MNYIFNSPPVRNPPSKKTKHHGDAPMIPTQTARWVRCAGPLTYGRGLGGGLLFPIMKFCASVFSPADVLNFCFFLPLPTLTVYCLSNFSFWQEQDCTSPQGFPCLLVLFLSPAIQIKSNHVMSRRHSCYGTFYNTYWTRIKEGVIKKSVNNMMYNMCQPGDRLVWQNAKC